MEKKTTNTDSRHKLLDRALSRHQHDAGALLEILHTAQEVFGYLPGDVLTYIAGMLDLPPSQVYGAASFYPMFSLTEPPRHKVTVCMGTACYVNGAAGLLRTAHVACHCGSARGGPDGDEGASPVEVRSAHCFGACGSGPVVQVDHRMLLRADTASVEAEIQRLTEEDAG